jgi:AcrR family transcriptional regulator
MRLSRITLRKLGTPAVSTMDAMPNVTMSSIREKPLLRFMVASLTARENDVNERRSRLGCKSQKAVGVCVMCVTVCVSPAFCVNLTIYCVTATLLMSEQTENKARTPDRILATALDLFNELGEPNVTSNDVANEMDISPGNLHYHFRSKSDIVEALFASCDENVSKLLAHGAAREIDVSQAWAQIHILFETMWAFRFVYRDIAQLISKYPNVRRKTARLMHRKISVLEQGCRAFDVEAQGGEADTLARNMALVLTYWLSFELVCGVDGSDSDRFGRGVYQVMSILAPYLDVESQVRLRQLASDC